jgi:hypothetical protein
MSQALSRSRVLLALAGALVAAALFVPAAHAGVLVSTATSCDDQTFQQPFVQWLDPASYVLAPDGGMEAGGAGWTLAGGAAAAPGNEPWQVQGAGDASLLAIPSGGSATSGAMCVGLEHPTLRFFAHRTSGSTLSTLRVDVLFEDAMGTTHALTIGSDSGLTTAWHPTAQMPVLANLLPLLPGDHTAVAFRFTPQGSGTWQVDDVFVDPARNG